jgi:hypothetical protein
MEDSAGNTHTVSPALIVFFVSCLVFSGVCQAQAEADPVLAEQAPADKVETELEVILKQNTKCLRCHSRDKFKTLEDGEQMSLQIHSEDFTGSAHGKNACVSCHTAISNRKHPSKKTNITINSQREYSLELNESCRSCHDKKFIQYEGSVHSSMVSQGSTKAPLCTDCHSAHAVESMQTYHPETGFPCRKCHETIFTAYTESVHGSARRDGNVIRDEHIQAPVCSDCHHSHDITAVEIGDTLRSQCFGCHENIPLLHSQWLPNAGAHLDIVSCAVCHAPFAKHRFDLHLYDNIAQVPVGQQESYKLFQQQLKEIEEAGGNVDPLAVWKLVEESNMENLPSDISLRGRMEVRSGIWAHQIAPKAFAVRTCDSCHKSDNRQALDVTVSVPQQDGRIQRYKADRENLGTDDSIDSISDFYALGGNPNKLLDILLLLSLAGGIAIPVGHYTVGAMIKEKMERGE